MILTWLLLVTGWIVVGAMLAMLLQDWLDGRDAGAPAASTARVVARAPAAVAR